MEDPRKAMEEAGFDVTEPVEVDLTDVREERVLLPPTSNVKLRIRKVTIVANKDNTYRQLNPSFQVEEGILVGGEIKYKGAVVFERICYYADPSYSKPGGSKNPEWFQKRQHLVALQQLMKALGIDMKTTINDEFLSSLGNQVVLASIGQKPNNFTAKDGTEVKTTVNTVSRFRAVPTEDLV